MVDVDPLEESTNAAVVHPEPKALLTRYVNQSTKRWRKDTPRCSTRERRAVIGFRPYFLLRDIVVMLIVVTTLRSAVALPCDLPRLHSTPWGRSHWQNSHDLEDDYIHRILRTRSLSLSFCFCWIWQKNLSIDVLTFAKPLSTSTFSFMFTLCRISAPWSKYSLTDNNQKQPLDCIQPSLPSFRERPLCELPLLLDFP